MGVRGEYVPEVVLDRHGNSLRCILNQSFLIQKAPWTLQCVCFVAGADVGLVANTSQQTCSSETPVDYHSLAARRLNLTAVTTTPT